MTWVKLDDHFYNHPKVVAAGDAAGWLYVCGLCYAAQQLTDGFIPLGQVPRLTNTKNAGAAAAQLVAVGLWDEAEGGYQIHDYLDYNPTAQKVKTERTAAAQRMKFKRSSAEVQPNILRSSENVQAPPSRTPTPLGKTTHPSTTILPPEGWRTVWVEVFGQEPNRGEIDGLARIGERHLSATVDDLRYALTAAADHHAKDPIGYAMKAIENAPEPVKPMHYAAHELLEDRVLKNHRYERD